nr:hypothetical protein [Tanacetum cinerariifolium]
MLVPHQVQDDIDDAAKDEDVAEPTLPSHTPTTTPPPPQQELISSPPQLMIEVLTAAAITITVASMPKVSAVRRRKGVVIRDPEETATSSVIVHSESKSKDKGKGVLVEEPKPLKKQAQIKQDKAYARELEAEINANINWNDVIEQVKRKEKQDNTVMRYQALKRKP